MSIHSTLIYCAYIHTDESMGKRKTHDIKKYWSRSVALICKMFAEYLKHYEMLYRIIVQTHILLIIYNTTSLRKIS